MKYLFVLDLTIYMNRMEHSQRVWRIHTYLFNARNVKQQNYVFC